jgi:hypothetical protein
MESSQNTLWRDTCSSPISVISKKSVEPALIAVEWADAAIFFLIRQKDNESWADEI